MKRFGLWLSDIFQFNNIISYHYFQLTTCHNTFIVTDQEVAIVNAIKKFLPEIDLFRCLNHVNDDIKRKLGTIAGLNAEERKQCSEQCKALFSQKSKMDYLELMTDIQSEWNHKFITYYNKSIRPDIDRIGAWACKKHGFSKLTTNQSESLNCVI
jgi:hypothetical protein